MSLSKLIRSDLQNFMAYRSARDEAKIGDIWLNANESPFPIGYGDSFINRYPEKQPSALIAKTAQIYGVHSEQILMTRGSDELIDLLIRLFCEANKDAIMTCTPTFGMYRVCAALQNAQIYEVPLLTDQAFALDLKVLERTWQPNVKIIFLCSPNNPTGNLLSETDLIKLCERYQDKSLIVIDEAYIEYASQPSASQFLTRYENLAILRTFSKAYGMAGLRLGTLLANKQLVSWINKIIAPYPIPSPVATIALQQLSDPQSQTMDQQLTCIREQKLLLETFLRKLPIIDTVWPSEANFLLIRTSNAKRFYEFCQQAGIVVRSFHDKPNLHNCIRISVGTPDENEQLKKVLMRM